MKTKKYIKKLMMKIASNHNIKKNKGLDKVKSEINDFNLYKYFIKVIAANKDELKKFLLQERDVYLEKEDYFKKVRLKIQRFKFKKFLREKKKYIVSRKNLKGKLER